MALKKIDLTVFFGVLLSICCWLVMLFVASGYYHESIKYKDLILTIVLVFIIQFFILDPIKFVIQAFIQTFLTSFDWYRFRHGIPKPKHERHDIQFLKLRIEWLKSRLSYNWRHRIEGINLFYQNVARDLFIYGRYFISLIVLIGIFNEPLTYYHSEGVRKVLSHNASFDRRLSNIGDIERVWNFIDEELISVFAEEDTKDNVQNWVPDKLGKLISVVRLDQVRIKKRLLGDAEYSYEDKPFFPYWKPYEHFSYKNKFWRTYSPFIPSKRKLATMIGKDGYLSNYATDTRYVAYLRRKASDSKAYLDYLKSINWLDRNTVALFIDFTVYNGNKNLFAFCHYILEQTPFGNVIMHQYFESEQLLINWRRVSNWLWLLELFYVLQLVALAKDLIVKWWYEPFIEFLTFWNILDSLIIILNILICVIIYLREELAVELLSNMKTSDKAQYTDFSSVRYYVRLTEIFVAILVFLATIRLWKVLLFARVFRLYVRTLQLGAEDIFWSLLRILLCYIGLVISSNMENGSLRTQSHAPLSNTHILSISLDYSDRVNPMQKSRIGNKPLGVIFYALIMFAITLILLNMLITLIWIHYVRAKYEERKRPITIINFWAFLKVEYDHFFGIFHKLRVKLATNEKLSKLLRINFEKSKDVSLKYLKKLKPAEKAERHANRKRRIRFMKEILRTQTELIRRRMDDLNIKINLDANTTDVNAQLNENN